MNKLKSTLGIAAIAFITLTAVSCKDNKKESSHYFMVFDVGKKVSCFKRIIMVADSLVV